MAADIALTEIGQISRSVSNIEEACKWYAEALGLERLYAFGDIAFFDCGGVRLYLSQSDKESGAESIIYFRVSDIREAHKVLKARGVKFIGAPRMIHRHENGVEEWMAFFEDPDGRPLAIMAERTPESSV